MRLLISLILLFSFSPYVGALTSLDRAELSFPNSLQDSNPGFESGAVKWTATPAITINSTAADQFITGSKQFAVWDSTSSGQEICSELKKVPESGNCAVSLTYKVPSGTATHKIVAKDGSKDLAVEDVVSSTAAWRHDVEFPCASAASNQARVCLRSVASNEPAIQLDGGYAGYTRNVGVADLTTEWRSFTPVVTSLSGSLTNYTVTGFWKQNGDTASYKFRILFIGSPGTWSTPQLSLPSGHVIDVNKIPGGSISNYRPFQSSRLADASVGSYVGLSAAYTTTSVIVQYESAGQAVAVTQVAPFTFVSGDWIDVELSGVPIVGWTASNVVMPDAQGWFAAGNISGANPSLGVGNVSTFTEITSASLTLTPKSGSAPVGIMCSGTNAAATPSTSSTTCSAGNESIGFNVSVPRSGAYEMCFHFAHNMTSNSNAAGVTTFQVIRTPTNSQTISEEGGGKTQSGNAGGSTAGTGSVAFMSRTACGNFNLSAGINGFRLMYEQSVGPTPPVASDVVADADASAGQRDIYFLMKPISQQQQAILANSVISRDAVGGQVTTINTVVSKTTTYTATANDETILMSASGGAWTLALPPAASVRGKKYYLAINAASANAVTINPDGTETICGRSTVAMLGNGDQMVIQSDGSNWVGLNNSCERRERARVVCNTPSSSISQQSTNWISTIGTISSGKCNLTFPSGICSTNPVLLAYATQTAGNSWVVWSAAQTTTTTGDITGFTTSGSALGAFTAELDMTCAR